MIQSMFKWIDIPPTWLFACAVLAWVQANSLSLGLSFGSGWALPVGALLVALGLFLLGIALFEFAKARTTPVPHQHASALITGGVFRLSRNPIYLGDILILAGLILRWDAVLSLPLIPVLIWIIDFRFIRAEEERLEQVFGDAFLRYKAQTRRWL